MACATIQQIFQFQIEHKIQNPIEQDFLNIFFLFCFQVNFLIELFEVSNKGKNFCHFGLWKGIEANVLCQILLVCGR